MTRASARMVSYEPADHAIGRSRGGLTTKAHLATDGNGRGLAVPLSAGQAGDSPMMPAVLDAIAVPRLTGGPPRCSPESPTGSGAAVPADGHRGGVATRYDKLASTYRAGFVMAVAVEWLKLLGDMT
ncbi:hypothetical protein ACFXPR_02975 [Nocardia tengchongensis]|uniref:hypothetical protein n=1 Tax=Nocardia tengchongensis TaxID=2055889 RepID=UPI0036C50438